MNKYYKTVVQIEILSQEPIGLCSLDDIAYNITEGDWSGTMKVAKETVLNGKQAAKALINQGSDPSFFQLDKNGNDIDI